MQADLSEEPKLDKDGLLRTPGTIEFFRLVNDDVSHGSSSKLSELHALVRESHAWHALL